jgi:hypothetical protein
MLLAKALTYLDQCRDPEALDIDLDSLSPSCRGER